MAKMVTMKKDTCRVDVPETCVAAFEKKGFVKLATAQTATDAQAPANAPARAARAAK